MKSTANKAFIHYIGALKDFFPRRSHDDAQPVHFNMHPSAKDLIEAQGVPHVEVYALKVNGRFISFGYNVQDGDYLVVYPKSHVQGLKRTDITRRIDQLPKRFVLDVHLGKLARKLRLMGIDSVYSNQMSDEHIISTATRENRAVLSRDLELLKHGQLKYGYWPRTDDSETEIVDVSRYFELRPEISPFTRCLKCNGPLKKVELSAVSGRVPEKVKEWNNDYMVCEGCSGVYWEGSHYAQLRKRVERIMEAI